MVTADLAVITQRGGQGLGVHVKKEHKRDEDWWHLPGAGVTGPGPKSRMLNRETRSFGKRGILQPGPTAWLDPGGVQGSDLGVCWELREGVAICMSFCVSASPKCMSNDRRRVFECLGFCSVPLQK